MTKEASAPCGTSRDHQEVIDLEAEQVDILVHLYPFAEDSASILFAKAAADKGGKGISVGDVHFGVSDAGDPWVQIGKAKYSAEEAQNLIVEFINGRTKRETDVRVTIEGIEKIGGEDYLFSDLVISGNFKKNERLDLYNILSGPPVDNYLPKSSENLLKPKAATLTFEGGGQKGSLPLPFLMLPVLKFPRRKLSCNGSQGIGSQHLFLKRVTSRANSIKPK